MSRVRALFGFISICAVFFIGPRVSADGAEPSPEMASERQEFARELTEHLAKAWKNWQDSVLVNNVEIASSRGVMSPGNVAGPTLTASSILSGMDSTGRSSEYIKCMKTVARALANGMRGWQRGYFHDNIPFPSGASSSYTLAPCDNIPVTISSGRSSGNKRMTVEALYSYMIYSSPAADDEVKTVLMAAARAFSECFRSWEDTCAIVGIRASGGIAPAPAPLGTGPGPVRGAKGGMGRLAGAYLDTERMYKEMLEYMADGIGTPDDR
jgi:hypothetical protein